MGKVDAKKDHLLARKEQSLKSSKTSWRGLRGARSGLCTGGSTPRRRRMNGCRDQPQWTPAGAASLVGPLSSEVYRLDATAPHIPACAACRVPPDGLFYNSQGKGKGQQQSGPLEERGRSWRFIPLTNNTDYNAGIIGTVRSDAKIPTLTDGMEHDSSVDPSYALCQILMARML